MRDALLYEVLTEAVRAAGRHAGERAGRYGAIDTKRGFTDLVTDVDTECEKILIDRIRAAFPGDAVLAEESGLSGTGGQRRWIIDPIDGTTNFAHGFPFFACSVAVEEKGDVVAGAVYEPLRDELFLAAKGEGATLNGRGIAVSERPVLKEALLATGFAYDTGGKVKNIPYFERLLSRAQALRRAGSAALDLCYVACGRLDGFWELGLAPWDVAAGQLIVKEAGGTVTQLDGREHSISSGSIVATNGRLHAELLAALSGKD